MNQLIVCGKFYEGECKLCLEKKSDIYNPIEALTREHRFRICQAKERDLDKIPQGNDLILKLEKRLKELEELKA